MTTTTVTAYQIAKGLFDALKADPVVEAFGSDDLVLWGWTRSKEAGWTSRGAPSIVWEGGPYEWAVALTGSGGKTASSEYTPNSMMLGPAVASALDAAREAGFYFECVTSWMLAVYPA